MTAAQHREGLERGCEALGIALSPRQIEQLLVYLELLQKWNRAYNLTAVREPREMIVRHLLDSLALVPLLSAERCIDVGTGAGLPGIPLAIAFPERDFSLLDSNGKKTRFLFQVKTSLGLDNMAVHHARVEEFKPPQAYAAVLSRAFASLADMVRNCRHLLTADGRFLAMKGQYPEAELAAIASDCELCAATSLSIPGLNEQRHLLELALR